ncbi:sugar transferase [Haloarcula laminariae]|uniref:sugar transferase n=1 Tax=Haloarcula laminariae TaxID=2961577 RepID=UPI0024071BD5|nr:sugar transferase [Halomicroarcula sp. FL173]
MQSGVRYRAAAICGSAVWVAGAVVVANTPLAQQLVTALPPLSNLQPTVSANGELTRQVLTTVVVTLGVLWPLFKPRPRRILDTVWLANRRVFITAAVLATIGYFDWSARLPRTTLIGTICFLGLVLPVWFVGIRRRPSDSNRAIVVGNDAAIVRALCENASIPLQGVVGPPSVTRTRERQRLTDGGAVLGRSGELPHLGGLSRLGDILVEENIDTVILAFDEPDRKGFFGALATCFEHGVRVKVHRDHADSVLVSDPTQSDIVDTNLEPWDWQDYLLKRLFDIAFSAAALVCLAPVALLIAAAVKLDSPGPVLYSQKRTAAFGETFTIHKFRSMVTDAEAAGGAQLSSEDAGETDPRVTRVGRVLRQTHLDEIPQLWSILVGDMSVVGPRPERPELDADIETSVDAWRSRWFVKPGLTGMAQIHGVTGHEPAEKIRYDIQYIRQRSFWFDVRIVVRQLYAVAIDAGRMVRRRR